MSAAILALVLQYSAQYNIDPHLVMAVIEYESSYNTKARGYHGEVGLMQLLPESFPGYTIRQLSDTRLNIKLGIKHLADVKQECKHKEDHTWIICYNLGSPKGNKVRYPKLFPYYQNVYPIYKRLKMFTPGQKVHVLNAHVNGAHDEGTIVKKAKGKGYEGQWLVNMGLITIPIETERLLTPEQYVNFLRSNGK